MITHRMCGYIVNGASTSGAEQADFLCSDTNKLTGG